MLRIGSPATNVSPTSPPPSPGTVPPELLAALAAASNSAPNDAGSPPTDNVPKSPPKFDAEKVDPAVARYLTSDSRCKSCEFFNADDSSCQIVAGPIDLDGVCSLFTPQDNDQSQEKGKLTDDGSNPSDSQTGPVGSPSNASV